VQDPDAIQTRLIEHIADLLDIPAAEIDAARDLAEYGLDSADAVLMAGALEEILGREVDPAILLRNRSVAAVIAELQGAPPA
jgi:acyl carrier protein